MKRGPGLFSRWLQDLTIRKKLNLLVGILVLNLLVVIGLSLLGLSTLSQVRAYVGGEGLYAKSQKNAVYSLTKYALSGNEKDYQDYLVHLKVPLGDHKARLALSQPEPDLALSDQGFLEGGNHPRDVRGMAHLLLRFHRFRLIAQAIQIWGQADDSIQQLQALGDRYHAQNRQGRPSPAQTAAFIASLDALNERLTSLENDFSYTMGEAARWAQNLLTWVMVLGSLAFGLLGVATALYFSRAIVRGVTLISGAASSAAQGDLSVRVNLETKDELGRLAEAFNAMAEGLSRIDQLKNNFVSTVSHELRTPLTLNLAPLESMLAGDYGPLGSGQEPVLRVMHNNAVRLLQMVNGLLDFSKLQAGKMPVDRQLTDVTRLCSSILENFKPAIQGKGLRAEAHLDIGRPLVLMDRYLLERILFNLLSNAVKFTPREGHIIVRLAQDGERLRLSVTDTGIGIAESDAKNLFQKFSQAEASSTRRYEGTGLGLALVKECAQLLEGVVTLKSLPGEGSAFTVECLAPLPPAGSGVEEAPAPEQRSAPRAPAPDIALPAKAATGPSAAALPKVLVVEDNLELASYIANLLAPEAQVSLCSDGLAGLAEAAAWKPDLILSDVMMPKMDGLALTRALKSGAATSAIPVVLLTALTGQQDLLKGWDAGADDYLFKPFHPRELQARVRSLLAMVAWRHRFQLQQKRQEILELFTRIASHDLKAPLRRMSSYAGLLLQDTRNKLGAESTEHLQVIARSATEMNAMIESLIQFSRLDAAESGMRDCDLGAVIADCLGMLGPALKEAAAKLDVGPMPILEAVPEQMSALFQNLISNSLKYRSPDRAPLIKIRVGAAGHAWHFSVVDNGLGFDPAQKDAVFDLFKRLDAGSEIPGEGMGLAIAKRIVEIHGGRIWAESAPGQGCAIHFTLLAAKNG